MSKLQNLASVLLVALFTFPLLQCGTSPSLSSIAITPAAGAATVSAVGQTVQYTAIGQFTGSTHPSYTSDVTNQVKWSSSNEAVATISATGLLTAVGPGTSTIVATMNSSVGGQASGSSDITSTATTSSPPPPPPARTLTSLTVIPSQQPVQVIGETAQYIAIGNFTGSPTTQDMTSQVNWVSSDVRVATIDSSGLATAIGSVDGGQTTITAIAPPSTGSAITGTATMTVSSNGTNDLPSLTVYKVGQGTGTVESFDPTTLKADNIINCGSGNGCTARYVLNSCVFLKATADQYQKFAGWSANCKPLSASPPCAWPGTLPDSTMCWLPITEQNGTVGAIFNLAP